MAKSTAADAEQYLATLPPERRDVVARVLDVVRANMPSGYEECMGWGMINWSIPLSRYPDTHNGQPLGYVCLGSHKSHVALYLMGLYASPQATERFTSAWRETGLRLDMGKSCLRFHKIEQLDLRLVAAEIARVTPDAYIASYERGRAGTQAALKKSAAKQAVAKKSTAKQAPAKRAATKAAKKSAAKKSVARTARTRGA